MDPATAMLLSSAITTSGSAIMANQADDGGYQRPKRWEVFGSWLAMYLNTAEGQRKLDEYEARTDRQQADALAVAIAGGPETLATFDASNAEALEELLGLRDRQVEGAGEFLNQVRADRTEFLSDFERRGAALMGNFRGDLAGFLGRLGTRHEDILSGYQDRYLMAEGQLEGYGEQMAEDIDRYFEEERMRAMMDLQSRGLLSSTEAAAEGERVTERHSAEQRRLEEALMMNRVNVLGGLSGESLAAQERMASEVGGYEYGGINTALTTQAGLDAMYAAYDAAMRGDEQAAMRYLDEADAIATGNIVNFYGQEARDRANIVNRGYGDVLNTIMRFNYVPPQMNDLNYQLGYNVGGSPEAPSPWGSFAAQAGRGMGQALYNWLGRTGTGQPSTPPAYESWEPGQFELDQWNAQAYPAVPPTAVYEIPQVPPARWLN